MLRESWAGRTALHLLRGGVVTLLGAIFVIVSGSDLPGLGYPCLLISIFVVAT